MLTKRTRTAALLALLFVASPLSATAEHGAPLPATIGERTCTLVMDLDNAIAEFGFGEGETPTFDADRLNRALVRGRYHVVGARAEVTFGNLTLAFRKLRAAVRELEKGASVPVSGFGFAEDLAILLSGRAEFFTEDLLSMSAQLSAVSADRIAEAELDYLAGVAARNAEEWEVSIFLFGKAIRTLEQELVLGTLLCS